MKMLNTLEKVQKEAENHWQTVVHEGFSILLRMLSPIAPHITQTLWHALNYGNDILTASWPEPIEAAMIQDEIEMMIQVNGKLRGSMMVASETPKETIEQTVLTQPCLTKFLVDGASVRKVIVVPKKLINVVIC
jgi:leucyl-tRNA synthetase